MCNIPSIAVFCDESTAAAVVAAAAMGVVCLFLLLCY